MDSGGMKMEIGCEKKRPHRPNPCGFFFNLQTKDCPKRAPVSSSSNIMILCSFAQTFNTKNVKHETTIPNI